MPTLVEIREEIAAKSKALHEIFEQAGPEMDMSKVTVIDGDSAAKAAEIKRRNTELSELGKKRDELTDFEAMAAAARKEHEASTQVARPFVHQGGAGAQREEQKSISQMIRESVDYKALREGRVKNATITLPGIDFKTLITLTTISPQNYRQPDIVQMALEERTVADLMLESRTDRGVVEYYEETTVTNAAATVAEGGTKPESALAYTLRTETIRKIATWIPATDEVLADVPFMEGQIRGRLAFMVRRQEESQILTGDGTGTNLTGLLNRSNVQTQAKGTDPGPDAIYKGMTKVRNTGFAEPTAVVFNPTDWQNIRLLRTADGIYIWGSPAEAGPERIWGLPIRQTSVETQGTALVGAFRPYSEVIRREDVMITMSTEHSTYFVENKVAILAEERLGLAVYRPTAFCKVTGL